MRITIGMIMELEPCYSRKFLKKCFDGREDVSPMAIVNCKKVRNADRIWLLSQLDIFDNKDCILLAVQFAENVLHIFEAEYPKDRRPRYAIESANTWLNNSTEENKVDAVYAARAARTTATARAAASASAYAARAAAYVADAVAAASDAYSSASASSVSASYAARAASASNAGGAYAAASAAYAASVASADTIKEKEFQLNLIKNLLIEKGVK